MRIPMQMWKQAQPLLRIPTTSYFNMEVFNPWRRPRDKVVFIMGATGTGKSRLSIDLATRFPAEIINSDKIQVYKGLDIVTNKVRKEEQCGFRHHLLGIIGDPNMDFTPKDFCLMATHCIESTLKRGNLPIVVGGSNSFIESLVSDPEYGLGSKYKCCFIWVDVSVPVLHQSVSDRVDQMVKAGMVEEVRTMFDPENTDYSHGIRRAIGVPEFDPYFRAEQALDGPAQARELQQAITNIKQNTCKLACRQLEKIYRLKHLKGWDLNRVDATEVLREQSKVQADEAWDEMVARPSIRIVDRFLSRHSFGFGSGFSAADMVIRSMNMIRNNNQAVIATTSV